MQVVVDVFGHEGHRILAILLLLLLLLLLLCGAQCTAVSVVLFIEDVLTL
jgi:hypothetical protein